MRRSRSRERVCKYSDLLFFKDSVRGTSYEVQFVMDGRPCEGADPEKDYVSIQTCYSVLG